MSDLTPIPFPLAAGSFWQLVSESLKASSVIEDAILLLLVLLSIVSWAIVIWKLRTIGAARRGNQAFVERYEQSTDSMDVSGLPPSPNAIVYASAQSVTQRGSRLNGSGPQASNEEVAMAMQHASRNEFTRMTRGMDILASIASASPFIGLLGTVLGIMGTFQVLGSAKSASLNVVAPGIAAALIATAAGLFVAIPAVFAYNRLMAGIDEQQEQTEMFIERLSARQRRGQEAAAPETATAHRI